jgi:hypothetical protein
MPKYYVQSGTRRGVVDCFDEECAAVWMVQLAMKTNCTACTTDANKPNEHCCDREQDQGMFALDDYISVSERGFDRIDAALIDTHIAFVHWHQLTKAIEALCDRMDELWD